MELKTVCDGPPLVELTPIPDIFATGVKQVEQRGEFVRLTFYSEREARDELEWIVVSRVIMPNIAFHIMSRKLIGLPLRLT